MAGEIGLTEKEYFALKPREFDRLYRGFLLREERAWNRTREMISYLVSIQLPKGKGYKPHQIRELPILDTLSGYNVVTERDEEYERRLREFGERLLKKENGK